MKWVCPVCGYVWEGETPPERCPQCKVPGEKFKLQEGEMSWAAEHVVGVGKQFGEDVPAEVKEEIISNAISASSRDPRFDPIRPEELKYLDISVDVLGEIEDIDSKDQLDVKRYGVIVSCGSRRGLLLPDLEGVDTADQQIDIAREKGNIGKNEKYKLQRFEVVRHY